MRKQTNKSQIFTPETVCLSFLRYTVVDKILFTFDRKLFWADSLWFWSPKLSKKWITAFRDVAYRRSSYIIKPFTAVNNGHRCWQKAEMWLDPKENRYLLSGANLGGTIKIWGRKPRHIAVSRVLSPPNPDLRVSERLASNMKALPSDPVI